MTTPIDPLVDKLFEDIQEVLRQAYKVAHEIEFSEEYENQINDFDRIEHVTMWLEEAIKKLEDLQLED